MVAPLVATARNPTAVIPIMDENGNVIGQGVVHDDGTFDGEIFDREWAREAWAHFTDDWPDWKREQLQRELAAIADRVAREARPIIIDDPPRPREKPWQRRHRRWVILRWYRSIMRRS